LDRRVQRFELEIGFVHISSGCIIPSGKSNTLRSFTPDIHYLETWACGCISDGILMMEVVHRRIIKEILAEVVSI
jgi:hypothetical protein